MTASWAGVAVAVAVLAGTLVGRLWAAGRNQGKIDAVLEQLARLIADHEDRLRLLEHRPARRR
ncbi:MAG: hypothetical protein ACRDPD_00820 [Streptosporangiaceae bacterium]